MPPSPLIESLIFQYDNLFQVLTATIRPLSRKQWVGGTRPGQIPVRQTCHILWACEMYAGGGKLACRERFGCAVHSLDGEIDPALYPTPKIVIEYAACQGCAYNRDKCKGTVHLAGTITQLLAPLRT